MIMILIKMIQLIMTRNISITKIQKVLLVDISIECMDKLHYDINAVIWTMETELLKYMGKSHVHFIII